MGARRLPQTREIPGKQRSSPHAEVFSAATNPTNGEQDGVLHHTKNRSQLALKAALDGFSHVDSEMQSARNTRSKGCISRTSGDVRHTNSFQASAERKVQNELNGREHQRVTTSGGKHDEINMSSNNSGSRRDASDAE